MALFSFLPHIMYRDMHATKAQLVVLLALKPAVSLFSFHWSHWSEGRTHNLRRQLLMSECLSRLPFLLFPWITNCWWMIAASGLHVALARGAQPAWMELLKRELPAREAERVFARGSTWFYLGMLGTGLALGPMMDLVHDQWQWVPAIMAAMGALLVPALWRMPRGLELRAREGSGLITPWIESARLLREQPTFARFQWGFFLAGGGLILMQPALPAFMKEHVQLSYTGVAVAFTVCKGIGFALTSSYWAKLMAELAFLRVSTMVAIAATLYAVCLLVAPLWVPMIFVSYLIYGVMQAGSELTWNMAGPIFAGERDSRAHTRASILLQGIRGGLMPALAYYLLEHGDEVVIILLGAALCLLSAVYLERATGRDQLARATT